MPTTAKKAGSVEGISIPATLVIPSFMQLFRRLPCLQHVHDITNFPKALGHVGGHRGRGPQRLIDANEIVVQREQRDRMRVVPRPWACAKSKRSVAALKSVSNWGNSKEPTTGPNHALTLLGR